MTLVLVAHGTRDPRGEAALREVATAVRSRRPDRRVELAFLELSRPLLADVLTRVPGPVTVVPLLLAGGYHVHVDLPDVVARVRPDAVIARQLGPHPLLSEALARRLSQAGLHADDTVILAAAGSSDPAALADVHAAAHLLSVRLARPVTAAFASSGTPTLTEALTTLTSTPHPAEPSPSIQPTASSPPSTTPPLTGSPSVGPSSVGSMSSSSASPSAAFLAGTPSDIASLTPDHRVQAAGIAEPGTRASSQQGPEAAGPEAAGPETPAPETPSPEAATVGAWVESFPCVVVLGEGVYAEPTDEAVVSGMSAPGAMAPESSALGTPVSGGIVPGEMASGSTTLVSSGTVGGAVPEVSGVGRRVAIASYLLAPGFFHSRLRTAGADLVSDPIGADPGLVALIWQRYDEVQRARKCQPSHHHDNTTSTRPAG